MLGEKSISTMHRRDSLLRLESGGGKEEKYSEGNLNRSKRRVFLISIRSKREFQAPRRRKRGIRDRG